MPYGAICEKLTSGVKNSIFIIFFLANTEANERRIRNVENCFGASGQVSGQNKNID